MGGGPGKHDDLLTVLSAHPVANSVSISRRLSRSMDAGEG